MKHREIYCAWPKWVFREGMRMLLRHEGVVYTDAINKETGFIYIEFKCYTF